MTRAQWSLGWFATVVPNLFLAATLLQSPSDGRLADPIASFKRFSQEHTALAAAMFILVPGLVGMFTGLLAVGQRRRRAAAWMIALNAAPWAAMLLFSALSDPSAASLRRAEVDRINREIEAAVSVCERGHAAACLMIAEAADPQSRGGLTARQFRALERGCHLHNARACARLGHELQRLPEPYDPQRARALFRIACTLDRRECRDYIGMLIHGSGGVRDCTLAWNTLNRNCAAGDADACDERSWPWVTALCPPPTTP